MPINDRATHLLVGALLLAAYFAGLPASLWQPAPALVTPVDGWLPSEGELQWQLSGLGRVPAGEPLPVVAPLAHGRLRLRWREGDREREGRYQPGQGWSFSDVPARQPAGHWLPLSGSAENQLLPAPGPLAGPRLVAIGEPASGWQAPSVSELSPLPAGKLRLGQPARLVGRAALLPLWQGGSLQVLHLNRDNQVLSQSVLAEGRGAGAPVLLADTAATVLLFAPVEEGALLFQGVDAGRHWRQLPVAWPGSSHVASPHVSGQATSQPMALIRRGENHWWLLSAATVPANQTLRIHESRDQGSSWLELPEYALPLPSATGGCEDSAGGSAFTASDGEPHLFWLAADCRLWHGRLAMEEGQ